MKMNPLQWISMILVVIGGLNWGLVGAFEFDLVAAIFGDMSALARIVYVLVGLGALVMLAGLFMGGSKKGTTPQQPMA